jgi:hypothetical protein
MLHTRVRLTASTGLTGSWVEYSSAPGRGITDIGAGAAGATDAASMADEALLADAALSADVVLLAVAGLRAVRLAVSTAALAVDFTAPGMRRSTVAAVGSTVVAVGSTVVAVVVVDTPVADTVAAGTGKGRLTRVYPEA